MVLYILLRTYTAVANKPVAASAQAQSKTSPSRKRYAFLLGLLWQILTLSISLMTQFALTPNPDSNTEFNFKFLKAKMISKGDPNQRWVKAILPNGEECFLFPDDENTVPVRRYPIGTVFSIRAPHPCRNPGATKWTAQVLNQEFQPPQLKALEEPQPESNQVNAVDSVREAQNTASNLLADIPSDQTQSIRVTITGNRIEYIDRLGVLLGIQSGYRTRSKVLEVILDRLIATQWLP